MQTTPYRRESLPLRFTRTYVWSTRFLQSFALLVARLGFGFSLFLAGRGHLQNVAGMVERFTKWNIPMPEASVYLSAYTEMIGGLMLMAGLFTRLVSLPLLFNFVVAYLTASIDKVKGVVNMPGDSEKWGDILDDAAFPFLVISLVFLAFGAGKVSIDFVIKRLIFGRDDLSTRRRVEVVEVEPRVVEVPDQARFTER